MFSLLEAVDPAAQFIGPIVGSSLLMLGVEVPFYFVFPVASIALPLILLLPTQPSLRVPKQNHSSEDEPLIRSSSLANPDPASQNTMDMGTKSSAWEATYCNILPRVQAFGDMLRRLRIVQFAAAALFVVTFGKQSLHILTQYASQRFHIPVAQAGYLLSVKAGVTLLLFLVVIPATRRYGTNSVRQVSMTALLRVSIVLLALGVLLMGLAPSLALMIPSLFRTCA